MEFVIFFINLRPWKKNNFVFKITQGHKLFKRKPLNDVISLRNPLEVLKGFMSIIPTEPEEIPEEVGTEG